MQILSLGPKKAPAIKAQCLPDGIIAPGGCRRRGCRHIPLSRQLVDALGAPSDVILSGAHRG
jgi:hypothetical protein